MQSSCFDCQPGWFANETASIQCQRCANGTVSQLKATACTLCAPGSYTNDDHLVSTVYATRPNAMSLTSCFLHVYDTCRHASCARREPSKHKPVAPVARCVLLANTPTSTAVSSAVRAHPLATPPQRDSQHASRALVSRACPAKKALRS